MAWGEAAYAAAVAARGDMGESERLARAARASLLASPRANSVRLGEVDLLLADVLERNSLAAEARQTRAEGLAAFQRVYGPEHPRTRAAQAALDAMR